MKKAVIIVSTLLILGIAGLFPILDGMLAQKDQVQITERVIEGDSALVEGVTVTVPARWSSYQYWMTTYKAGKAPQVDTEYNFYSQWDMESEKNDERKVDYNGIYFLEYSDFIWGNTRHYNEENQKLADIAKTLEFEGEEAEFERKLSEYVSYYPVSFMMDLPGSGSYIINEASKEKDKRDQMLFEEFFKIPVLEEETMLITLQKRNGKTYVHGSAMVDYTVSEGKDTPLVETEPYDHFRWRISSETDDSAVYFTFCPYSENGKRMDLSLIPGGFGVYRLPYTVTEDHRAEWSMEELELLYSIPVEAVTAYDIYLTTDARGELLVFYGTKEGEVCAVVDPETGEEKQRLLFEAQEEKGFTLHEVAEDFFIYNYGFTYTVVDWAPERGYAEQMTFTTTENDPMGYHDYWEEGFDWDGERLLYADYRDFRVEEGRYLNKVCDFVITVYDETGRIYYGIYETSLQARKEIELMDGETCSPHRNTWVTSVWPK